MSDRQNDDRLSSATPSPDYSLLTRHKSMEWARHENVNQLRHRLDFEYVHMLGSGGFGKVYKVINKLDGRTYALKCVPLSNQEDIESVLHEAEVLARLPADDHIVRYYAAWIEKADIKDIMKREEEDGKQHIQEESSSAFDETTSASSNTDSGRTRDPKCDLCQGEYKDWEVGFEDWGLIDSVLQPKNLCTECYFDSLPSDVNPTDIPVREQQVLPKCLFILMESCHCTLKDVMNDLDEKTKWAYFAQCVKGLTQVHREGFVHRDVKPTNIFVHQGTVKIGDLGLATRTRRLITEETDNLHRNRGDPTEMKQHSSQVGTYIYTAPEVKTGKYDESCDIYSLGIVLIELFGNFDSMMERASVLQAVKEKGTLPINFTPSEEATVLVNKMISRNPGDRPRCHELASILKENNVWHLPDSLEAATREIVNLQSEVLKLKATLLEKEETILELKNIIGMKSIPGLVGDRDATHVCR